MIHDGAKNTGMKSYASRMTERELWDLVNYIRGIHYASAPTRKPHY